MTDQGVVASSPVPDPRRWLVLAAMVFGLFMPLLDNLVVNVALPTIERKLGTGLSGLQWIVDAYSLAFAALMLTAGSLGDIYGRKRLFQLGLLVFTLASLACGLSTSIGELIVFRAIQGVGAAMLLPVSLSILTATFTGKELGAALGIWGGSSGLAVAAGPPLGGWLVAHVSWQAIFFVNVPVGVLAFTLTARFVRESRDQRSQRHVDLPGLATGSTAVFFLVYGLIEANARGWTDAQILGSLAISALLIAAFIAVESRRDDPMLPLSFFRIRAFTAATVVAVAVFFVFFGSLFFLALFLQNVQGYSASQAGVRLLPFSAAFLLGGPIFGRLAVRYGARRFMTAGMMTIAAGTLLMLRAVPTSSYVPVLLPCFVLLGVGIASTMPPLITTVMRSVDVGWAGVAASSATTSRELGGVLGIAVLGAVATSEFHRSLLARLAGVGFSRAGAVAIVSATSAGGVGGRQSASVLRSAAPPGTSAGQIHGIITNIQSSFTSGIHAGMIICTVFALLAALMAATFVPGKAAMGPPDREAQVALH